MKRLSLTALLLVLCIAASGVAETAATRGKIALALPHAPAARDEINLDKTFFTHFVTGIAALPEYAAYAEMIEGVFIRVYDKTANLDAVRGHHQERLETEEWQTLVKIRDKLQVSVLFAEELGIVNGIFVDFTTEDNVGFANIYGTIDFQKLGALFGKLLEAGGVMNLDFFGDIVKNDEGQIKALKRLGISPRNAGKGLDVTLTVTGITRITETWKVVKTLSKIEPLVIDGFPYVVTGVVGPAPFKTPSAQEPQSFELKLLTESEGAPAVVVDERVIESLTGSLNAVLKSLGLEGSVKNVRPVRFMATF